MPAAKFNKKKAVKRDDPQSKRKKKDELFTPKRGKKEEENDSDLSDALDVEEVEDGMLDADEQGSGSGSGSEVSSDGDDPLADDFFHGSDEGDYPFFFFFFLQLLIFRILLSYSSGFHG